MLENGEDFARCRTRTECSRQKEQHEEGPEELEDKMFGDHGSQQGLVWME